MLNDISYVSAIITAAVFLINVSGVSADMIPTKNISPDDQLIQVTDCAMVARTSDVSNSKLISQNS